MREKFLYRNGQVIIIIFFYRSMLLRWNAVWNGTSRKKLLDHCCRKKIFFFLHFLSRTAYLACYSCYSCYCGDFFFIIIFFVSTFVLVFFDLSAFSVNWITTYILHRDSPFVNHVIIWPVTSLSTDLDWLLLLRQFLIRLTHTWYC